MNLIELSQALRQLRLGGMAVVLETRLRQAQGRHGPIDLISVWSLMNLPVVGTVFGTTSQTGWLSRHRRRWTTLTSTSTRR